MPKKLPPTDRQEIADLYRWGARMLDIMGLYGVCRMTVRNAARERNVPSRAHHCPPLAEPNKVKSTSGKPIKRGTIKSSRPPTPEVMNVGVALEDVDQLIRSSAHAQRDKRIAARRLDESIGSCQASAS